MSVNDLSWPVLKDRVQLSKASLSAAAAAHAGAQTSAGDKAQGSASKQHCLTWQMQQRWQCWLAGALSYPTAAGCESTWPCACSLVHEGLEPAGCRGSSQTGSLPIILLLTQLSPFISLYCTLLV